MGIRFIFGRAGSGKSHYCLNQIKKKLDNQKGRPKRRPNYVNYLLSKIGRL